MKKEAFNGTEDSYILYLNSIAQYPSLSQDEEDELCNRIKNGDESAKDTLFKCNLRLVVFISKLFKAEHLTRLDLIQEGNIGLMKAVIKFDSKKGKFSVYATILIKAEINRAIENKNMLIRQPVNIVQLNNRIRKFEGKFFKKYGRLPSIDEIAGILGIPSKKVKKIKAACKELIYLDKEDEKGIASHGYIKDHINSNLEEEVIGKIVKADVESILERTLSKRDIYILLNRCGYYDGVPKTAQAIATELGVSKSYVSAQERRCKTKLSSYYRIRDYRQYYTG